MTKIIYIKSEVKLLHLTLFTGLILFFISCSKDIDEFYIDPSKPINQNYLHSLLAGSVDAYLFDYKYDQSSVINLADLVVVMDPETIVDAQGNPFNGKFRISTNDLLTHGADAILMTNFSVNGTVIFPEKMIDLHLTGLQGQVLKFKKSFKVILKMDKAMDDLVTTFYVPENEEIEYQYKVKPTTFLVKDNEAVQEYFGVVFESAHTRLKAGTSFLENQEPTHDVVISASIQELDTNLKNIMVLFRSKDGKIVIPLSYKDKNLFRSKNLRTQHIEGHIIAISHLSGNNYGASFVSLGITASINHADLVLTKMSIEELKAAFDQL
jgi:hypothetical protein